MTVDSFLTVEDINTTLYNNQGFWWHEIDTWLISETEDFIDVIYDFCKVSRETITLLGRTGYRYTVKVYHPYFANGFEMLQKDGSQTDGVNYVSDIPLSVETFEPSIRIFLYMGCLRCIRLGFKICLFMQRREIFLI